MQYSYHSPVTGEKKAGYRNFEKHAVNRTNTTKPAEVIRKNLYDLSLTVLPLFIDTNLFLLFSDISQIQMGSDKTHRGHGQKRMETEKAF